MGEVQRGGRRAESYDGPSINHSLLFGWLLTCDDDFLYSTIFSSAGLEKKSQDKRSRRTSTDRTQRSASNAKVSRNKSEVNKNIPGHTQIDRFVLFSFLNDSFIFIAPYEYTLKIIQILFNGTTITLNLKGHCHKICYFKLYLYEQVSAAESSKYGKTFTHKHLAFFKVR